MMKKMKSHYEKKMRELNGAIEERDEMIASMESKLAGKKTVKKPSTTSKTPGSEEDEQVDLEEEDLKADGNATQNATGKQ